MLELGPNLLADDAASKWGTIQTYCNHTTPKNGGGWLHQKYVRQVGDTCSPQHNPQFNDGFKGAISAAYTVRGDNDYVFIHVSVAVTGGCEGEIDVKPYGGVVTTYAGPGRASRQATNLPDAQKIDADARACVESVFRR